MLSAEDSALSFSPVLSTQHLALGFSLSTNTQHLGTLMLRINDILDKVQSYLSPSELGMIEKAYIFSASVHPGADPSLRRTLSDPSMEVCGILADMKLDAATLVTGLLHDTVEGYPCHAGADRRRPSARRWRFSSTG